MDRFRFVATNRQALPFGSGVDDCSPAIGIGYAATGQYRTMVLLPHRLQTSSNVSQAGSNNLNPGSNTLCELNKTPSTTRHIPAEKKHHCIGVR